MKDSDFSRIQRTSIFHRKRDESSHSHILHSLQGHNWDHICSPVLQNHEAVAKATILATVVVAHRVEAWGLGWMLEGDSPENEYHQLHLDFYLSFIVGVLNHNTPVSLSLKIHLCWKTVLLTHKLSYEGRNTKMHEMFSFFLFENILILFPFISVTCSYS